MNGWVLDGCELDSVEVKAAGDNIMSLFKLFCDPWNPQTWLVNVSLVTIGYAMYVMSFTNMTLRLSVFFYLTTLILLPAFKRLHSQHYQSRRSNSKCLEMDQSYSRYKIFNSYHWWCVINWKPNYSNLMSQFIIFF